MAVALAAASFIAAPGAQATLGQRVESVATDATRLTAVAHASIVQGPYTVHTIALPSGTVVREYAGADGIVFGVAWEGPTLPDLKTTLGTAFDRFAGASPTRGGSPLAVSADDLVVYSGGHLRAFSGRAYLPHALPAGVDAGVVR
ncbi:hypothetical protein C0Z18_28715 [Trinickia dabaoshanensis]|uniref:DUF2844 domain-containing protein n=1 Tax=Trinickia dabaoshanensis TaxID=564714 RepID=A0A2N7VD30_9BURK|nr:DUF2844 domain-containing protein [Trinickia dabaoshanensis]PMS15059.1 hypothetical protein C0Z18_28715 [Trinickia dabaoshanensis]